MLAGLAGLLAAALAAGSGPARPALAPAESAALPRTVCDIGPGELCDRYAADLRARAPVWGRGGRWAAATRDAFDWAASQNGGRGLDGLSPSPKLDRALEAPQLARLSAVERAEWRRAMEAHWRIMALDGPYERALRRARGMDWPSRAPRVIFLVLVAAGPALVVLLAVRNAVANARRRDEAVDAAVAAVLAGGTGPAAM